ncbi:hypothetical protein FRB99_003861 [Tulasnella sp. 403]|nr:hypothetical protein FRB99_003861 [Tulasnella sp. 403]
MSALDVPPSWPTIEDTPSLTISIRTGCTKRLADLYSPEAVDRAYALVQQRKDFQERRRQEALEAGEECGTVDFLVRFNGNAWGIRSAPRRRDLSYAPTPSCSEVRMVLRPSHLARFKISPTGITLSHLAPPTREICKINVSLTCFSDRNVELVRTKPLLTITTAEMAISTEVNVDNTTYKPATRNAPSIIYHPRHLAPLPPKKFRRLSFDDLDVAPDVSESPLRRMLLCGNGRYVHESHEPKPDNMSTFEEVWWKLLVESSAQQVALSSTLGAQLSSAYQRLPSLGISRLWGCFNAP